MTAHDTLEPAAPDGAALRDLYLRAFAPSKKRAATRRVMCEQEWADALAAPALRKLVGRVDGAPRAFGIATASPAAVHWLSEDFFRHRYPAAFEARSLWYVMTVCVDGGRMQTPLLQALLDALIDPVPEGGVIVYDECQFNAEMDLGRMLAGRLARRGRGADGLGEPLDRQTFYGLEVGPAEPRAREAPAARPMALPRPARPSREAARAEPAIVPLADDPSLREPLLRLSREGRPAFMSADPVEEQHFPRLLELAPHLQLAMVEGDEVIASAHATPLGWRRGEPLPDQGWSWALAQGVRDAQRREPTTAACALAITVAPGRRHQGLGTRMLRALREHAARTGAKALVGPVRPDRKCEHPQVSMEAYAARRRADGLPEDPWLRAHVRCGAEIVGVCQRSMTVAAPMAQWERWTGIEHRPGELYLVPEALAPVWLQGDVGVYVEPNVWVVHDLEASPVG